MKISEGVRLLSGRAIFWVGKEGEGWEEEEGKSKLTTSFVRAVSSASLLLCSRPLIPRFWFFGSKMERIVSSTHDHQAFPL